MTQPTKCRHCLNARHVYSIVCSPIHQNTGSGVIRDKPPEITDEILTTARDLELEVNEDDIEDLINGHEDELTTEDLQESLKEEHQETHRNVSPSEQEENERGPMTTSAIKDFFEKVGECESNGLRMSPKPS
ncbi:uncharacterized protein TNCV_2800471 [Trichonephila clavipes]|nr:uncharacterized protein TNCV_2800471 [Trichonephila clavipes]